MKPAPITAVLVGFLLFACGPDYVRRGKALQQVCIDEDIRPRLKDPDSLRIIDRLSLNTKQLGTYKEGEYTDFAILGYTATNSFGERVSNRRTCGFIDNTLIMSINVDETNNPLPLKDSDWVIHRKDLAPKGIDSDKQSEIHDH